MCNFIVLRIRQHSWHSRLTNVIPVFHVQPYHNAHIQTNASAGSKRDNLYVSSKMHLDKHIRKRRARQRTNLRRYSGGKKEEGNEKRENCVTLKLSSDTLTQWRTARSPFADTNTATRRSAHDVATGSVTAVYERCSKNIRSSRRSLARP